MHLMSSSTNVSIGYIGLYILLDCLLWFEDMVLLDSTDGLGICYLYLKTKEMK